MFGESRAATLPPTMEAAPTEQTRLARTASHLVGIDDRIASTVFGTITAMATVAAYGRAFPDEPWTVEELVLTTAVVLWLAHLYTHALSESISERHALRFAEIRRIAGREVGILLAAVPPSVALLLGALGVLDETTSIWLALALSLGILALEGVRYARIESLGAWATFVAVAMNLGLGLLVVLLKIFVLH